MTIFTFPSKFTAGERIHPRTSFRVDIVLGHLSDGVFMLVWLYGTRNMVTPLFWLLGFFSLRFSICRRVRRVIFSCPKLHCNQLGEEIVCFRCIGRSYEENVCIYRQEFHSYLFSSLWLLSSDLQNMFHVLMAKRASDLLVKCSFVLK